MKYAVEVEYSIRRTIVVHAANQKIAGLKAAAIVKQWHDKSEAAILSVSEAKEKPE